MDHIGTFGFPSSFPQARSLHGAIGVKDPGYRMTINSPGCFSGYRPVRHVCVRPARTYSASPGDPLVVIPVGPAPCTGTRWPPYMELKLLQRGAWATQDSMLAKCVAGWKFLALAAET